VLWQNNCSFHSIQTSKPINTMAQVTLSVPNEKLPVLNDFLASMGIQNKNVQVKAQKYSYKKASGSLKNSTNYLFKKYLSWEYFSNELEFE
jgi:hypothetical protein